MVSGYYVFTNGLVNRELDGWFSRIVVVTIKGKENQIDSEQHAAKFQAFIKRTALRIDGCY
jgi:hypothetical protein